MVSNAFTWTKKNSKYPSTSLPSSQNKKINNMNKEEILIEISIQTSYRSKHTKPFPEINPQRRPSARQL